MRRLSAVASIAACAVAVAVALAGSAGAASTRAAPSAAFAGGAGPVWSPDGTQLAFVAPARTSSDSGDLGLDRVVVANADGSGAPHAVVAAPKGQILDEVRWGAGGRFVYADSNYTLWSDTGTKGKAAKRIATLGVTGESFALSRDGREVAFTAPCDCGVAQGTTVGVVRVTGGEPRVLVRARNVLAESPSFSPDGRRVVFTRILVGAGAPKYPANAALVVETPATGAQQVVHTFGQSPAFSPDGRRIAFLGQRGLEVIAATGGAPRTILPFRAAGGGASFSWSPDSRTLAYATGAKVGAVDLAGRLTTFAIPGLRPNPKTPQWSPDGRSIAFSAIAKADEHDLRVYVIGADGADLRRVA